MLNGIGHQVRFGVTTNELNQRLNLSQASNDSSSTPAASPQLTSSDEPKKNNHVVLKTVGAAAVLSAIVIAAGKYKKLGPAQKYFDQGAVKVQEFYAKHMKPTFEKIGNFFKSDETKDATQVAEEVIENAAEKAA